MGLFAVLITDFLSASPLLAPALLQNLKWERNGDLIVKWSVDWRLFQSRKVKLAEHKILIAHNFHFNSFMLVPVKVLLLFAQNFGNLWSVWVLKKIFLVKVVRNCYGKVNF